MSCETAMNSKGAEAPPYCSTTRTARGSLFFSARQPDGRTRVKSPFQLDEVATFFVEVGAEAVAGAEAPVMSTTSTLKTGCAIWTATGSDQAICFAGPGKYASSPRTR